MIFGHFHCRIDVKANECENQYVINSWGRWVWGDENKWWFSVAAIENGMWNLEKGLKAILGMQCNHECYVQLKSL